MSKLAHLFATALTRRQRKKLLGKMVTSSDDRATLEHHLFEMRRSLLAHLASGGKLDHPDAARLNDWIGSLEVALGIAQQVEL